MDQTRLTGRVLNCFRKIKLASMAYRNWKRYELTRKNRCSLVRNKVYQEKPKKSGAVWTDDWKDKYWKRMKRVWEERKRNGKKPLKHAYFVVGKISCDIWLFPWKKYLDPQKMKTLFLNACGCSYRKGFTIYIIGRNWSTADFDVNISKINNNE